MKKLTYISLFSSAGVGCYGFKMEGYDCIATNELIERRLEIQKFNKKCKYDTGYICGDITDISVKKKLYSELEFWKKNEKLDNVDVVIATPPCQGMSVANQKKNDKDLIRNSLVVESIKVIKKVKPNFFIFENVPAFMKTICTDIDGKNKSIADAIEYNLGQNYSYTSRIINFKNYGACSSRQRTLVIGVAKKYSDEVSPYELYPDFAEEKTLRQVIGNLKPLNNFGEIDPNDIYHSFRLYPEHMRSWISDIKEGESAFDNDEDIKKPHQIKDGELIINKQKNGDKYKRQYWDKVGPCIHTRNDQLASQNTIHPSDDRVFSIRELMRMMTVPDNFKWVATEFDELNLLPFDKKRTFLKKEELKIRQSLGEAVPTIIFQTIAKKISNIAKQNPLSSKKINAIIEDYNLVKHANLINFIDKNPLCLSLNSLSRIAELSNTKRTENAAYFTSKSLITEIMKNLPESNKNIIRILEPSVGVGNFLPIIIKKFEEKSLIIDVVDIDNDSLEITKKLLNRYNFNNKVIINYIHDDFLLHKFDINYDYIIGNPPFLKMKSTDKLLSIYRENAINKETTNICSFFLDKAVNISDYVVLVFPKFLLNTPEFKKSRQYLSKKAVDCIIDFGEYGFPGVLVETISIFINNLAKPNRTYIQSYTKKIKIKQKQNYIFDKQFPYWIIYRNQKFDEVCAKLDLDVFSVFRDRQITKKIIDSNGDIRILKSRNISDDGKKIIDIPGYDAYIKQTEARKLAVYDYLNAKNVYISPNMTYKPRVMKKPMNCIVNGSLAILKPKNGREISQDQLSFFSTEEYREFYQIARNYQTRSLNIDSCSVFFFGLLKKIYNYKIRNEDLKCMYNKTL